MILTMQFCSTGDPLAISLTNHLLKIVNSVHPPFVLSEPKEEGSGVCSHLYHGLMITKATV